MRTRARSFGCALLSTGDLDPVYVIIRAVPVPPETLARVLLAYFMFYHMGVSARLGVSNDFYSTARDLLPSAPRGTERRHFRGELARTTIDRLEAYGQPADVLRAMAPAGADFWEVSRAVQRFYGFGTWIAFKVADTLDRVGWTTVPMDGSILGMYSEPAAGASLYFHGRPDYNLTEAELKWVVQDLLDAYPGRMAPPTGDRPLGVAEVETILCKFKSHLNGHYQVGKDIREVLHGLDNPEWGPLAREYLAAGNILLAQRSPDDGGHAS